MLPPLPGCPNCHTQFTWTKLLWDFRWHLTCPACGTKLMPSADARRRFGAAGGFAIGLVFFASAAAVGPDRIRAWPGFLYWLLYALALAYILGRLQMLFAEELVPYDRKGMWKGAWTVFENVSTRHRVFILLGLAGLLLNVLEVLLHKFLAMWLSLGLELLTIPFGILMLIGMWHWLFGAKGLIRGKK